METVCTFLQEQYSWKIVKVWRIEGDSGKNIRCNVSVISIGLLQKNVILDIMIKILPKFHEYNFIYHKHGNSSEDELKQHIT